MGVACERQFGAAVRRPAAPEDLAVQFQRGQAVQVAVDIDNVISPAAIDLAGELPRALQRQKFEFPVVTYVRQFDDIATQSRRGGSADKAGRVR